MQKNINHIVAEIIKRQLDEKFDISSDQILLRILRFKRDLRNVRENTGRARSEKFAR